MISGAEFAAQSQALAPLDAHHITPREQMPGGGYVKENGISLCDKPGGCHAMAEMWLAGKEQNDQFSIENLYKLISSSVELAVKESNKLK